MKLKKINLKPIKSLLNRGISILSLFILMVMVSSCIKGFKKVTVRVFDVDTNEGIEGIDLYVETSLGETDRFETNADGLVELGRREYIRGSSIQTNLGIPGYTTPDFFKNCTMKTSYSIEGKDVEIPLEKLPVLKLSFELPKDTNITERKGCCKLISLEQCPDANVAFEIIKTTHELVIPGNSNKNPKNNFINAYMIKSPTPWIFNIFYDFNSDCGVTTETPDQILEIPMNLNQDTTFYTVQLK